MVTFSKSRRKYVGFCFLPTVMQLNVNDLIVGSLFKRHVLLCCRGVVRVDVDLQDVDIDQCSTDGWFAGTHRCNLSTMEVSAPDMRPRQGSIRFGK